MNQMSDICQVIKYQPLKDGFRTISQKIYRAIILWGHHFVVGGPKISFDNGFQKTVLSNLLLFSCAC